MEQINDYVLKITGGASLDKEVEPSKNIIIKKGELSVYEVSKRDNQDGTFNLVYKAKFVSEIDFEQEGKPIRGADKTAKSRKLRGRIWSKWSEDGAGEDFDNFYDVMMTKLIINLDEVFEFLKDK